MRLLLLGWLSTLQRLFVAGGGPERPWIALGEFLFLGLVYGIFAIPAVGFGIRLLWERAYPERID